MIRHFLQYRQTLNELSIPCERFAVELRAVHVRSTRVSLGILAEVMVVMNVQI